MDFAIKKHKSGWSVYWCGNCISWGHKTKKEAQWYMSIMSAIAVPRDARSDPQVSPAEDNTGTASQDPIKPSCD